MFTKLSSKKEDLKIKIYFQELLENYRLEIAVENSCA